MSPTYTNPSLMPSAITDSPKPVMNGFGLPLLIGIVTTSEPCLPTIPRNSATYSVLPIEPMPIGEACGGRKIWGLVNFLQGWPTNHVQLGKPKLLPLLAITI